jgi:hypothetical protein
MVRSPSPVVGYCVACHEGNDLPRTDWLCGVEVENRPRSPKTTPPGADRR